MAATYGSESTAIPATSSAAASSAVIPDEYRTTVCATTIEVGSSVPRPHGPANQARAEGAKARTATTPSEPTARTTVSPVATGIAKQASRR